MNLPIKLPFLEKAAKPEYYLALLLRDEKVTAVVFEQFEKKAKIIGRHEEYFPDTLETATVEDLVQILDRTISKAEAKLPADVESRNTIFGVKDTWVEDKKIKKEHLSELKKVCDHLQLVPMGFIIIAEAMAHLIQKEEGIPLSALLTEVGKSHVSVSLFRAGKLIEAKHAVIHESPMKTVDTVLKEFERVEIFPSRVILFHASLSDSDHKDALAQKFIAHQWSKTLPFLHVPQISILPANFDTKSIVFGAAVQLGFELVGLPIEPEEIKTYDTHHKLTHTTPPVEEEELEAAEQEVTFEKEAVDEKEPMTHEEFSKMDADNFGFVVGEDITHVKPHAPIQKPVHQVKHTAHAEEQTDTQVRNDIQLDETDDEEEIQEERSYRKKAKFALPSFAFLSNIKLPLHKLRLPKLPRVPLNNRFVFIPPLILLIVIGGLLLYVFKLKATVTLVLSPRMVDETQRIALSTTSGNDFSQNIIAAKEISVSLEGTAKTATSGEKEIGEKAKGTVTLYNSSDSRRTVKSGTTITSSNGRVFLTDKEVAVASASGDIFTGIKSGTVQVAVTAKEIGTEYNVPSNTQFSVEGSSVLAAKNDAAFSGGSKKKVTVVAKADVDKITKELPKSLEEKAKQALAEKAESGEVIVPEFTEVTLGKKKLSKEIDNEAKDVTLTATVTFVGIAYQKKDLLAFSQETLKNKYSQDQTIPEEHIKTTIGSIKKDDEELQGILEIQAGLLPKFDNAKIAKDLTGKSFVAVDAYAKDLPQVDRAEIALSPNLPFLPKTLPRMGNNITVLVQPNE